MLDTNSDPVDAKVATEVAKAFLGWSAALQYSSIERLCGMLDETVYVDVQSTQPRLHVKTNLSRDAACESFKGGDLAGFLKDFGPAEVHAEVPTLLPTLFQIHGGAYMRLDEALQKNYQEQVLKSREAAHKAPLACTLYNVLPAGDLFKVGLTCNGVLSYRVLLRRAAPGDFKVMQYIHLRP
ncbi:MAG: hypothetical protein EXR79_12345 [Myxococcales bacterium]|nr:hypothetical protein [Myxococcales bacterium]